MKIHLLRWTLFTNLLHSNMTIFTWLYSFYIRRPTGKSGTKRQIISLRFYILRIGTSKEVWELILTLSTWVVLGNIPDLFKCYFIGEMNMIIFSSKYMGRIKGDHVCNAFRTLPSHWKTQWMQANKIHVYK